MDSDSLFSSHTVEEIRAVEHKTRPVISRIVILNIQEVYWTGRDFNSIFLQLAGVTLREKKKIFA